MKAGGARCAIVRGLIPALRLSRLRTGLSFHGNRQGYCKLAEGYAKRGLFPGGPERRPPSQTGFGQRMTSISLPPGENGEGAACTAPDRAAAKAGIVGEAGDHMHMELRQTIFRAPATFSLSGFECIGARGPGWPGRSRRAGVCGGQKIRSIILAHVPCGRGTRTSPGIGRSLKPQHPAKSGPVRPGRTCRHQAAKSVRNPAQPVCPQV